MIELPTPLIQAQPYDFWNASNVMALVGLAIAIISAYFTYLPIMQQRRAQRLLEREFGAEFYDAATIERSTRYYVRPDCSSVDPAHESEIRHTLAAREPLFSAIDRYLDSESPHRHILLLADSGMGKSSFVLNYYVYNQQKPRRNRHRLAIVPLGIPDALEAIGRIEQKKDTVLFLDAFDEDTRAIQHYYERLHQIMQTCHQFKRVLITCRTQFFPKDEEIPVETGLLKIGPRKAGESGTYEFWKLYLSPLTDAQVKLYLKRRYPYRRYLHKTILLRRSSQSLINKIPLLSVRPMLMSYIPDVLESNRKISAAYDLYQIMVDKWLDRESGWIEQETLKKFSVSLAFELYDNRKNRGSERISRGELLHFAKLKRITVDDRILTTRSLLNRDAQGNLKFAHRSIMEFLCVQHLLSVNYLALNKEPYLITDQMNSFLADHLIRTAEVRSSYISLCSNYKLYFIGLGSPKQEEFYNKSWISSYFYLYMELPKHLKVQIDSIFEDQILQANHKSRRKIVKRQMIRLRRFPYSLISTYKRRFISIGLHSFENISKINWLNYNPASDINLSLHRRNKNWLIVGISPTYDIDLRWS